MRKKKDADNLDLNVRLIPERRRYNKEFIIRVGISNLQVHILWIAWNKMAMDIFSNQIHLWVLLSTAQQKNGMIFTMFLADLHQWFLNIFCRLLQESWKFCECFQHLCHRYLFDLNCQWFFTMTRFKTLVQDFSLSF